jgi:hypothetical protein
MKCIRVVLYGMVCCFPLLCSLSSYANECAKRPEHGAKKSAIIHAALTEYGSFNGHRIDPRGRLWKFGATETENEALLDPETGEPTAVVPNRLAWRRVWEYWLTLDKHVAGEAMSRKVLTYEGALEDNMTDAGRKETRLSELFSVLTQVRPDRADSLRQAAVRAALSDSPWSAAFISYVMHQAGLENDQFRYAAAHWQYVKQAFGSARLYAYRACDPRDTRPSEGDLLCYSRGELAPKDFAAWRAAVNLPGFSAASHCEIVVMVDRAANKIETIGGNVLQSVAMRRLMLNKDGLLSTAHYLDRGARRLSRACVEDKTCRQSDLNAQRWSVLLQLR